MSAAAAAPGLAQRLSRIVDGVCRAIAVRMARDPASRVILWLAWTRLRRAAARFAALAARAATATTPLTPRPRAARQRPPPAAPIARLPQRFAWLFRLVPEAPGFRSQFGHLLADPEMVALIRAVPQAARILRPLCRILSLRPMPPILAPPPRPPRPRRPANPPPPAAARPDGTAEPDTTRRRRPLSLPDPPLPDPPLPNPPLPGLDPRYLPPRARRS